MTNLTQDQYVKGANQKRIIGCILGMVLSILTFLLMMDIDSNSLRLSDGYTLTMFIYISYSILFMVCLIGLLYQPNYYKQYREHIQRITKITPHQDLLFRDLEFVQRIIDGGLKENEYKQEQKDMMVELIIQLNNKWDSYSMFRHNLIKDKTMVFTEKIVKMKEDHNLI